MVAALGRVDGFDMRILAMSVPEPNDTSAEAQFDARRNAGGGGCGP